MSILKFLERQKAKLLGEKGTKNSFEETEAIRKILQVLDGMEPEHARYIAVFAFILSRVARADLSISGDETREMERLVQKEGGLSKEQAILVVQTAKTQNRLLGGTENFQVTHEFNKIATVEQKRQLLNCLYAVSAADQSITTVEDNEVSETARELFLSHDDLVTARLRYRQYLSVLKKPDASP
jgi:uncharacterized tellurite resistance protein B-like protein